MIYDSFWSVPVVLTWTEKWKQYFLNNSYRAECYVHLTFKQKYVLISFGYKKHEMSLCNLLYLKGRICWCILVVQQHFNNAIKTIFKAIQCHWNGTKWVVRISQFVINPAKRHYWCFSFFFPIELLKWCDFHKKCQQQDHILNGVLQFNSWVLVPYKIFMWTMESCNKEKKNEINLFIVTRRENKQILWVLISNLNRGYIVQNRLFISLSSAKLNLLF